MDKRLWKLNWTGQDPSRDTYEYTLSAEKIDSWNELITTHKYLDQPSNVAADLMGQARLAKIKEMGFNPKVTVHLSSPLSYVWEWQLTEPKDQVQDELEHLFMDKGILYSIRYTIKKGDMGSSARASWIKRLRAARVKAK